MLPLTIVSSDRPATLIERLALDLGQSPLDPFATETIIVQSRGTERWIRHELARRHGCAASLAFPFAASFFRGLTSALAPDLPDPLGELGTGRTVKKDDTLARDTLVWRILHLMEHGLTDEPGFEALRPFVGAAGDRDTRKILGLARTMAARYEEYQLYRSDLLLQWESDDATEGDGEKHAGWQALLWRRLCETHSPDDHIARLYAEAIDILNAGDHAPAGLPTRLAVFGVNTLPPVFVRLLHAVGRHIPVRVYLQAPPRATWMVLPISDESRATHQRSETDAANPVFATFGCVVRELVVLLEQHAPADAPVVWEEHHAAAPAETMLARLQDDVRTGTHRGPEAGLAPPVMLSATRCDESLSVHRCHSPMREMEVLRDQILAALAADPSLRPHDILLLLTDVPLYAPFVEAVFGVGEPGLPYIPHRIADRPIVQECRLADAALRILRLVGARWTGAEVIELLDLPPVRRGAGIADGANENILRWIVDTRIRWGRDGAMRGEIFGLPKIEANSWRAGIDRLLMGYATGPTNELVADVLPHAGHTIGDPETLGAFARFIDCLFDTLTDWRTARSLPEWAGALRGAFTALLAPEDEDEERELDVVLCAVDTLADLETDDASARAVELPVVRDWLEQRLGDETVSSGFLTGGMTVCALKPMRVVPHRIVAIAGLDDATFPRRHQRPAFDMMAATVRDGDRNRRADDRQLFLDTLLAAEDRLILTYVARSAKTNAERAASVVVAELLDVVDRSFLHPERDERGHRKCARELVEVEHRLQPFSPAYFSGPSNGKGASSRLFSYSRVNARALAAASIVDRADGLPFVTGAISSPLDAADTRDIRLEDLIACWSNPSRFFCNHALGIRLPGENDPLDDCEPMTVDKLDEYLVHDTMLRRHLAGGRVPERERIEAMAQGNLPSGALAGVWFDRLSEEITALLDSVGSPEFHEPVAIAVRGATWTLTGRVDGVTGDGRLQVRPAACKPKDRIVAWITHLALTAQHGPVCTDLIATDTKLRIAEVAEPMPLLDALIEGYRATLREPIPFFAQASYDYAKQVLAFEAQAAGGRGRSTKPPLDCARAAFDGSEFGEFKTGDRNDLHVALAWRGRDPLVESRESFGRWSMDFWRPALGALTRATGTA